MLNPNYEIYNECNNLVYSGEMDNRKRDGKGIEYCSQTGEIIYEGSFKDGYYEGEGILYASNGIGNGGSIKYYPGNYYEGIFRRGLLHGKSDYYNNVYNKIKNEKFSFLEYESTYINGFKNGYESRRRVFTPGGVLS